MFKVNNKYTRATPEQVIADWDEENCCYFNTDLVKNGYLPSGWNKSLELKGGCKIFLKINNLVGRLFGTPEYSKLRYNQSK